MSRYWLAAIAILCLSGVIADAQTDRLERKVKAAAGHDVRVGIYANIRPNCTADPLPAIRLVSAPAHGAVSVKRGTLKATNLKQYLGIEVPAFGAFVAPPRTSTGLTNSSWKSVAGGHKRLQHFRVDVSTKPGGGQGI
jgi:hypothetical protein